MATACGRARISSNAIPKLYSTIKCSSFSSFTGPSKFHGFSPASPKQRFSFHHLFTSSTIPVELGCAQSLMPLHSVTSSALFTSLLSLHSQS